MILNQNKCTLKKKKKFQALSGLKFGKNIQLLTLKFRKALLSI
jgi:hypothetical protein